ncbi:MAG: DNA mismatch repair endonuclease MutL [Janthinobacterium lividum]
MAQVQVLDENTANQIAAGEVVERPAAAVKELVENALDAGARQILVELDEGGKYLIRVTDDGSGMSREDAVLSLQRHATSKIRSADDLFQITTMGFRGEALPSIASVSQMSITTKAAGDDEAAGVQIRCAGGILEEVSEIGARAGTSITVENLFYNVPARLKFLKSSSTELNHIVELMQRFALARPDVSFRLLHGTGEVFSSGGSGAAMDACVHVFGRETARHLVPLNYEVSGLRVTGYIGTPAALKSSRSSQHTFVNKRFVRNKAVTRALDEAYKSVQTLHGTRYPAAVVMIDIDPSQVDVNVSPTKTEVRFTSEGDIYAAVYKSVQEALMAGGLVPTLTQKLNAPVQIPPAPNNGGARGEQEQPSLMSVPSRPAGNTRQEPRDMTAFREAYQERAQNGFDDDPFEGNGPLRPSKSEETAVNAAEGVTAIGADYRDHNLDSLRVLAQTRNMYILAQTDDALVLIDQHIAHERVLYEKLLAGAEGAGGGVPTQRLMIPFTLELSRRETMVIEKRLEDLRRAGFDLEPFGGDSFVVRSVPASVAQKHLKAQGGPEEVLREIVDELVEKTVSRRLLLPAEEVLITASCKMAVKAGDPLTFEEMNALVADLLRSDNPYTCPHGRPIIVELPNGDLDRKFGR